MIWCPSLRSWRPMTKRERRLAALKAQERARERAARHDAERQRALQRKRDSWERMKADIAARYAA